MVTKGFWEDGTTAAWVLARENPSDGNGHETWPSSEVYD